MSLEWLRARAREREALARQLAVAHGQKAASQTLVVQLRVRMDSGKPVCTPTLDFGPAACAANELNPLPEAENGTGGSSGF